MLTPGDMHHFVQQHYPGGLDEEMAIGYLRQIMNGFMEIQEYNVMHRDMKPNNLFLKSNNVLVIGDFGFAKHSRDFGQTKLGRRDQAPRPPWTRPSFWRDSKGCP